MRDANCLKKLELLGAAICLYVDSYFSLREKTYRNMLDHYYQDSQDGISLDIKLFAKEVESLKRCIIDYDEDLVRHSLRRFKYYLSKIESYKRVGIDAKKLSMSNLVDFSKALRVAILLCEDTLDVL